MNIPEKETFGFFDELGQRTKFYRGLSKERRLLLSVADEKLGKMTILWMEADYQIGGNLK
jgi:hypothetical protein